MEAFVRGITQLLGIWSLLVFLAGEMSAAPAPAFSPSESFTR
jgi:hypothetical protein